MTISNTEPVPVASSAAQVSDYDMAEWDKATAAAPEVLGHSLYGGKVNDKKLDSLIGVPFVIQHLSFREGDVTRPGQKRPDDYVSVEVLIHPQYAARFNRKYVVFNDGSTGIYRQVVKFLVMRGDIDVSQDLPESGDANTTRYDIQLSDGPDSPAEFDGPLKCPEGLRKSEYRGPTGDAVTWYLA